MVQVPLPTNPRTAEPWEAAGCAAGAAVSPTELSACERTSLVGSGFDVGGL